MSQPFTITFLNDKIGIVNGVVKETQRRAVGCASIGHIKPESKESINICIKNDVLKALFSHLLALTTHNYHGEKTSSRSNISHIMIVTNNGNKET